VASSTAASQNVSSLQQLLQLKNRVLAAMQAHGLGSPASPAAVAGLPVSAPLVGASAAAPAAVSAPQGGLLQGPLAIPALIVVLIVVVLAIWICLPARKRKPATDVPGDAASNGNAAATRSAPGDDRDSRDAHSDGEPAVGTAAGFAASAAAGVAAGAAYAAQASPTTHDEHAAAGEAQAESETEAGEEPETDPVAEAPEHDFPVQPEPPFSFEEGATGGLPTHDPQRSVVYSEEARTPYDTGLLLGLLEMHAHRREAARFEELAHELWDLTDGEGPDWRRAASMGRGLDPNNPLYADDPYAAYRSEHDASSGFAKPLPDVDLDLPEILPPIADPASSAPSSDREGAQASGEASAHLPEATPPAHVPVAESHEKLPLGLTDANPPTPSAADEIEHGTSGAASVAGLGAGERTAPTRPVAPGSGAPNFGALNLDFDLELTPNAAAPGSSPSSHDLATIARNKLDLAAEYIDLGDRAGARTLLNEVLATQDPATRERAEALLATLA
jgi:FimV-like protein